MADVELIRELLETHHEALSEEVGAWVEDNLSGLPAAEDDASGRAQAREILGLLGEGGWLRVAVPGNGQLDLRSCCLLRESIAAGSPLADAVFALQCLGTQPVFLAGEGDRFADLLSAAAEGKAMAAFAMTEEAAGSDVSGMVTEAARDGSHWVLDGRKRYISNAGIADFYVVFAVTDRSGPRPALSAFLVPSDADGLRFAAPQVMSEPHPLGEIELVECRLPETALLGAEGSGFQLGMATLDRLRVSVAAAACGMGARALAEALDHAAHRQQFGRPLSDFQLVQQKLAVMATELDAARLLTYRAAATADRGSTGVTLVSAKAKWFATEAAQRIVDQAVQIHGGSGVMQASTVDRLYRAVRSLRIYEGSTEIQQLVVARELLKASQCDPR